MPWSTATDPVPPHCGHVTGCVPGSAPDPPHVWQVAAPRILTGRPAHGVVEGDPYVGLQVRASDRLRPAAPAASPAEQPAEQVTEVAQVLHGEPADVHTLTAGAGEPRPRVPTAEPR
jgi:hypothetical protein